MVEGHLKNNVLWKNKIKKTQVKLRPSDSNHNWQKSSATESLGDQEIHVTRPNWKKTKVTKRPKWQKDLSDRKTQVTIRPKWQKIQMTRRPKWEEDSSEKKTEMTRRPNGQEVPNHNMTLPTRLDT